MNYVIELLAAISLTILFVDSTIFWPIRKSIQYLSYIIEDNLKIDLEDPVDHFLTCYQCTGFWIGTILFSLLNAFKLSEVLLFALIVSLLSLFCGKILSILKLLEAKLRSDL